MKLTIDRLTKRFGTQTVFENFCCAFPDNGFYLLLGESGCGKSTLLNILSGMIDFDGGTITVDGEAYTGQVDWDAISQTVAYMTQDAYWIDYLTIGEQLELTGSTEDEIRACLRRFGLQNYYSRYFNTLSGGQKQRAMIAQAILQHKRILLLDEPTASLDEENKHMVFQALQELRDQVLILCSSHDEAAREYCTAVLDFTNLSQSAAEISGLERDANSENSSCGATRVKRRLFPYYKQWFRYPGREKKSSRSMVAVYVLVFLALFLADIPPSKIEANMEYMYRINHCAATVSDGGAALMQALDGNEDLVEVVMAYNGSSPDDDVNGQSYDNLYNTIPASADAFRLSDRLAAGTYFTGPDQVILPYRMALKYGDPKDVVGEYLNLHFYDGKQRMEIVGVFSEFSQAECQYLLQGIVSSEDAVFISGDFTRQFQDVENFNWHGQRSYVLYFSSYDAMHQFCEENAENPNFVLHFDNVDYNITSQFTLMFAILLPLGLLISICSIVFYFQTKRVEMIHNRHLLSLYDYLGFSKREIERCWIRCHMIENLKLIAIAAVLSAAISLLVNVVNFGTEIVPFIIFTYNIPLIIGYIVAVVLLTLLISHLNFRMMRKFKWYELFLEQRDLL